jgi:hypothetical protein
MQQDVSRKRVAMPSPAMIVAVIALIAALGGSAYAATKLGKNSIGSRQLKAKAVTGAKIANNAVNSTKVSNSSLTGQDINLGALGTVPSAVSSSQAGNANTVSGHPATCPGGTILIRGVCFDAASNPQVTDVKVAADKCAEKGGYLPDPLELSSAKGVLDLGKEETSTDRQYTDTYYANTSGSAYSTIFVTQNEMKEGAFDANAEYICVYPLVR